MNISERYRPKTWAEVVGQPKVLTTLDNIRATCGGLAGQVLWISGPSGTGKSTIARLVANEVADAYCQEEINGADVGMDVVRDWERRCQYHPLGTKGQHAFIVNEAHGLSGKVVSRLLTTLELPEVQATSTWLFTTTPSGNYLFGGNFDAKPFLSRAVELELSNDGLELAFAVRLRQIAGELNLDGQPIDAYVRLVRENHNNFRACLQKIVAGGMKKG